MKVYISGPISAAKDLTIETKHSRFYSCEDWIRNHTDWEPVNPLKLEACQRESEFYCGGPQNNKMPDVVTFDHTWECWMRYDLKALLDCRAIALLPRWEESPGAAMECDIARTLGMTPYFTDETGRIVL